MLSLTLVWQLLVWFLLFNGILTFMGYLMLKPFLLKSSSSIIFTYSWADTGVQTFPKNTYLKVNMIVRLKFELAYYNVVL